MYVLYCLQIVEEEEEGSDGPEERARSSCWAGQRGGSSSDATLRQPLLQKVAVPWRQQKPKVCSVAHMWKCGNNRAELCVSYGALRIKGTNCAGCHLSETSSAMLAGVRPVHTDAFTAEQLLGHR
jgi:hypothetical protein